jgi:ubiquinone/menaquinone biosynthesis C-methylase UbiE
VHYTTGEASDDGIGKFYMGREISFVMGHQGADWLERVEREQEERPQAVIDSMGLRPDSVVADIGAGTGYFSFRIAKRVPQGKVLAVDIQQEMLDLVEKKKRESGVANVSGVLGTISDPGLAPDSVDFALLVDAYHEFSHPREMMTSLVSALRPGGRIVLVEYRGEDDEVPIRPHHKMTQAQAKKEMAAVGLRFVETKTFLPWQHVMFFEKPEPAKGKKS